LLRVDALDRDDAGYVLDGTDDLVEVFLIVDLDRDLDHADVVL